MTSANYGAIAEQYCRDVTSGRIPSCKWVILAAERHLRDLTRQNTEAFPYHFDPAKAARACGFIERLPHVKGSLAGQPISLEPFQVWIVANLFGWLNASGKKTGKRRFRRSYIELPRGNGKSTLMSGISLYMLAADGEQADCYVAATTRDQAKIVYGDAAAMAKNKLAKPMMEHLGVNVHAHSLTVPKTNSKFHALSAEASSLEGLNCHWVCVDEIHAHPNRAVWDAVVLGAGKRDQSLVMAITTAGFDLAGIGYELHTYLTKILQGVTADESQFGCIWTIDDDDDWQSPESWRKANPNLGFAVDEDFFAAIANEAISVASKQPGFKTKYCNLWLSNMNQWADMPAWKKCMDETLDIAQFKGKKCYMGLDLGAKTDLAAKVLMFPEGGKYYVFTRYYLPDAAVHDGRNSQYKGWHIEGRIACTEGNIIDYDEIERDIISDLSTYEVADIGVDPWESTQLVQKLMAQGAVVTEIMQTVAHLSEPTKQLDAWTRSGQLVYNDPILMWCASNVVVREDTNSNIKPNKMTPAAKIDGVIALILSIARYLVAEDTGSVYEDRGIFTI